jgi:hypothetical protein
MKKLIMMCALGALALSGCKDKPKEAPAPVQKATDDKPKDDKGALPAECNDYKAAVDKVATCDKLPAETRDQLKKAFDTTSATWASLAPEAKAGLAPSCKAALDAVTTAAKTTCGW